MSRICSIWWILLFALLLRLYGIDNPIIGNHEWRQTDTAIMAKNFFENGYRLFYPQMNWGGGGYVESEFPIYPYLVALMHGLLGYSESWGRLVTVVIYLVGLLYLYRLVDAILNRRVALWTAFFFAVLPMNILYSRTIMPDAMMITGSIAGVYHFWRWTQTDRMSHWFYSLIGISLAVLIKIPALYLGLPLAYLCWLRFGYSMRSNWKIWLYIGLLLAVVSGWYYHAHQVGLQSGISFGMWSAPGEDKWGNWALVMSWKYWNRIIFEWWIDYWFVTTGFVLALAGLGLSRRNRAEYLFDAWLAAVLVYYFIVGVGNYVHNYYSFPLSVPMVVYMGKACAKYIDFRLNSRWVAGLVCLLAVVTSYVSLNSYYQKLKDEIPERSAVYHMALAVRSNTAADAKILCFSPRGSPTALNLTYRKGWLIRQKDMENPAFLAAKRQEGAGYLVIMREDAGQLTPDSPASLAILSKQYRIVAETKEYLILQL